MAITLQFLREKSGPWVEPETGARAEFDLERLHLPVHESLWLQVENVRMWFDEPFRLDLPFLWSGDGEHFICFAERGFYLVPFEGEAQPRWFCRPGLEEIAAPPMLPPSWVAIFRQTVAQARERCRRAVDLWAAMQKDIEERQLAATGNDPMYRKLTEVQCGEYAFEAACFVGGSNRIGIDQFPRGIFPPYSAYVYSDYFTLPFGQFGRSVRISPAPRREQYADALSPTLRVLGADEWRLLYEGGLSWSKREGWWLNGEPADPVAREFVFETQRKYLEHLRRTELRYMPSPDQLRRWMGELKEDNSG